MSTYNGFPFVSGITDSVKNEINRRMSSPASRLDNSNSWCKITSGVYKAGIGGAKVDDNLKTMSTFIVNDIPTNTPENITINNIYGIGDIKYEGLLKPGITELTVEHMGNDGGGIRKAKIKWTTYSIGDFEELTNYFLAVGRSCLIEWGTFSIKNEFDPNSRPIILDTKGIEQFSGGNFKTAYELLQKKSELSNGNYDGMLGIITNYDFSLNENGGFDCTTEVTSLGAVMYGTSLSHQYNSIESDSKKISELQNYIIDELNNELSEYYTGYHVTEGKYWYRNEKTGYHAFVDQNANENNIIPNNLKNWQNK